MYSLPTMTTLAHEQDGTTAFPVNQSVTDESTTAVSCDNGPNETLVNNSTGCNPQPVFDLYGLLTGTFYPDLDVPNILILMAIIVFGLSNAGVILSFALCKQLRKPFNCMALGRYFLKYNF